MPIPAEPAPRNRTALIAQLAAGHPQGAQDPREGHAGRALDVVVVAAHPVPVARQQAHGIDAGPVLEVDAAARKDLLDRLHELLDELVELGCRDARLPQAQVERIVEQLLVVRAEVDVHRQQVLRRHGGAGRVELQLADGDAHAVGAQVAQAEDALAGRGADDAHVLDRPVPQHVLDPALVLERHVQAARPAEDVAELQARLADRRGVDDRQEPRRVGHQHLVEERLVGVEQLDQVDVALQVGGLLAELLQDALDLGLVAVDRRRAEARSGPAPRARPR